MKETYKICNICGKASKQEETKFVCSECNLSAKNRSETEKKIQREIQQEALRRSMNMNCW